MSKRKYMSGGNTVPEWKLRYIRVNHEEQTAQEMAKLLDMSDSKVYQYCNQQGIKPKPSEWHRKNRQPGTIVKGHPYVPRYSKVEVKSNRPPAVYSNQRIYDLLA